MYVSSLLDYLCILIFTWRSIFQQWIMVRIKVPRGVIGPYITSRFLKPCALILILNLPCNLDTKSTLGCRPLSHLSMQLFLPSLFSHPPILTLEPILLNILFLDVWCRVVGVIVWFAFESILSLEHNWGICWKELAKRQVLDCSFLFFK